MTLSKKIRARFQGHPVHRELVEWADAAEKMERYIVELEKRLQLELFDTDKVCKKCSEEITKHDAA